MGRHNDDILVPARGGGGLRLSSDPAAPPTARLPAGLLLSAFMTKSFRTVYEPKGPDSNVQRFESGPFVPLVRGHPLDLRRGAGG